MNYKEEIIPQLQELFSIGDKFYPVTSPTGILSTSVYELKKDISKSTYHIEDQYLCICNDGNLWINGFFAHNITRHGKTVQPQEITHDKLIPNMCYQVKIDNTIYMYKHYISSNKPNIFDTSLYSYGFIDNIKGLIFTPFNPRFDNMKNFNHKTIDFKLNPNNFYSII